MHDFYILIFCALKLIWCAIIVHCAIYNSKFLINVKNESAIYLPSSFLNTILWSPRLIYLPSSFLNTIPWSPRLMMDCNLVIRSQRLNAYSCKYYHSCVKVLWIAKCESNMKLLNMINLKLCLFSPVDYQIVLTVGTGFQIVYFTNYIWPEQYKFL